MGCISLDLTIDGALADPMIAAAMRADRIDPRGFEHLLRSAALTLDRARSAKATPPAFLANKVRGALTGCKPQW